MKDWYNICINPSCISNMNKDEINGKRFEISILKKGKEGEDTLCYKVYNDLLGEFVIGNCHDKINSQYIHSTENYLNGSCVLSLDDGECNFIAELTIKSDDTTKGVVFLRCK